VPDRVDRRAHANFRVAEQDGAAVERRQAVGVAALGIALMIGAAALVEWDRRGPDPVPFDADPSLGF